MDSFKSQYQLGKQIGEGTHAKVYQALHLATQQFVAVKFVEKKAELPGDFRKEISISQSMKNNFIAEVFEVFDLGDQFALIMEYLEGGTLLNFVNSHGPLDEVLAHNLFEQLILGLKHCHSNNVVHRDLKAENVLLTKFNTLKLIDFGLSRDINYLMDTPCGSPNYAAPEILRSEKYTESVDIWSAGVLLYGMVHSKLPFQNSNFSLLFQQILSTEPDYNLDLSGPLLDLLKRMLAKNPAARITLDEISQHPWMKKFNSFLRVGQLEDIEKKTVPFVEEQMRMSYNHIKPNSVAFNIIKRNTLNQRIFYLTNVSRSSLSSTDLPLLQTRIRTKYTPHQPKRFSQEVYKVKRIPRPVVKKLNCSFYQNKL